MDATRLLSMLPTFGVLVVVLVGMGVYYAVIYRTRLSPAAHASALAQAGFRPNEAVRASFVGTVLFEGTFGPMGSALVDVMAGRNTRIITATLTTHDRLVLCLDGAYLWFEGPERPTVQLAGRIMLKDTTGVLDAMAGQSETTVFFSEVGAAPPPGTRPKLAYNTSGAQEESLVVDLFIPRRPHLRIELVASGLQALGSWSATAPVYAGTAPLR